MLGLAMGPSFYSLKRILVVDDEPGHRSLLNLEGCGPNTKGSVEAGVRLVKLDSPRDEEKLKSYLNCV